MAKPSLLQTLLGRPSQSYTLPQQKQYYSDKAAMMRIAESIAVDDGKPEAQSQEQILDNDEEDSDAETDVFYTPRSSIASDMSFTLTTPPTSDNDHSRYTDQDWANDVQWLATAIHKPKRVPVPVVPAPRSSRSPTPSLMMSMAALLEEDEDPAHRVVSAPPSTVLVSRSAAHRRARSLGTTSSSSSYAPPPLPSGPPDLPSYGTPAYTSLSIPTAPAPTQPLARSASISQRLRNSLRRDTVDLTRSRLAQATMASIEVVGGLASHSRANGPPRLGFTHYRAPPKSVPKAGVLVQVWAVGLDAVDLRLLGVGVHTPPPTPAPILPRSRTQSFGRFVGRAVGVNRRAASTSESSHSSSNSLFGNTRERRSSVVSFFSETTSTSHRDKDTASPEVGFVPGRAFVGRVLECGWDVRDEVVRRGEWVVGLLDVRKSGALAEFITVDRHRIHRVPHPPPTALAALCPAKLARAHANVSALPAFAFFVFFTSVASFAFKFAFLAFFTSVASGSTRAELALGPPAQAQSRSADPHSHSRSADSQAYSRSADSSSASSSDHYAQPNQDSPYPSRPSSRQQQQHERPPSSVSFRADSRQSSHHVGSNNNKHGAGSNNHHVGNNNTGAGKHRRVRSAPPSPPAPPPTLSLDELALIPLGIAAHRAVRTLRGVGGEYADYAGVGSGYKDDGPARTQRDEEWEGEGVEGLKRANPGASGRGGGRRRRALVLQGHAGTGGLVARMLARRGWHVCVHAPGSPATSSPSYSPHGRADDEEDSDEAEEADKAHMRAVQARVRAWGVEEVVFDDGGGVGEAGDGGRGAAIRAVERLIEDGDEFDAVVDTVGGKEVWEASGGSSSRRRWGDVPGRPVPSAKDNFRAGLRALRGNQGEKGGKKEASGSGKKKGCEVGYAWVSAAQDVDWEGEDVRDGLGALIRMALEEGVRPVVEGGPGGAHSLQQQRREEEEHALPFERAADVFEGRGRGAGAHGRLLQGGSVV
ncbi:hypothetical protein C8R43DRAFT_1126036 [Mycena crocata]|nr:hypothetical protein C8R43DRAFT_1126036 [Mycena crocata]